ncbi:MAG: hypothetical protein AAFQ12_00570, partial [Pseudomonadota bacterium]
FAGQFSRDFEPADLQHDGKDFQDKQAAYHGEGKRIFLMAPLHHHFQKKNWPETRVVVRFWILSLLFALAGLATLKLR